MDYLTLAFGIAMLVMGASYFVECATSLAKHLRLHVAVFGALIVAIGTSLPELAVTVESAIKGLPDIIIGNILGSNIANIGLAMGTAILLGRISPSQVKLNGNNTLLLILSLIFIGLLQLTLLFWPTGILLLALAGALVFDMAKNREPADDFSDLNIKDHIIACIVLAVSLVGIIVGSQIAVNSSLAIAQALSISVGVVAATMIAVGTSLPELVITIVAIHKKQPGLAVGNVIGSNLFKLPPLHIPPSSSCLYSVTAAVAAPRTAPTGSATRPATARASRIAILHLLKTQAALSCIDPAHSLTHSQSQPIAESAQLNTNVPRSPTPNGGTPDTSPPSRMGATCYGLTWF